jgi:hypothetical protein
MNDETIISLAIERPERARYREAMSNPKKRDKLLDTLNHNPPLDSRYTTWFSSFTKALKSINIDPTSKVYLLSSDRELDGKTMTFGDALDQVPLHGWGTIIGVSPDLALYYAETGERAAVIERKQIQQGGAPDRR